jgi:hypothetical protein
MMTTFQWVNMGGGEWKVLIDGAVCGQIITDDRISKVFFTGAAGIEVNGRFVGKLPHPDDAL